MVFKPKKGFSLVVTNGEVVMNFSPNTIIHMKIDAWEPLMLVLETWTIEFQIKKNKYSFDKFIHGLLSLIKKKIKKIK